MRFVTRVQTGFKPGAQSKIIRNARRQTLHCICNFLEAKNKKTYFRESPKSKSQTFMKFKNHRFYDLFDHYIKLKVHFFLRLFWGLGWGGGVMLFVGLVTNMRCVRRIYSKTSQFQTFKVFCVVWIFTPHSFGFEHFKLDFRITWYMSKSLFNCHLTHWQVFKKSVLQILLVWDQLKSRDLTTVFTLFHCIYSFPHRLEGCCGLFLF